MEIENRPKKRGGPRRVGEGASSVLSNSGEKVRENFESAKQKIANFRALGDQELVEKLKELWEERGISSDDPVYLILDACAMFEARNRSILGLFLDALEDSDRLSVATNEEIGTRLGEMRQVYADHASLVQEIGQFSRDQRRLIDVVSRLLEFGKQMVKAILELNGVLGSRNFWGILINWAIPVLAILVGVLIGRYFL